MSDLKIIRNLKRDLIRMRREIEFMNGEDKRKAWKAYAELLTSLEIGKLNDYPPTKQPSNTSS